MKYDVFTPADIMVPAGVSLENWSVIACDQFSAERDYWERVSAVIGDEPSTLNLIIPEAFLGKIDEEGAVKKVNATMEDYVKRGYLTEVANSYIYIERKLSDGRIRRGLVGKIDLEEYDFTGCEATVLASEGTVLDRLPARVKVRRNALLELPHIIAFIDDAEKTVIEPLAKKSNDMQILYDFHLMEGGGSIRGFIVTDDDAQQIIEALRNLKDQSKTLMVIGDGNHSLAAAKVFWDEIKTELTNEARQSHPARFALLEINNVYDDAIDFEAIHRVILNVEPMEFINKFTNSMRPGSDYEIKWLSSGYSGVLGIEAECIGDLLSEMQESIDTIISETGCQIDYIHAEDTVMRISQEENCLGLILPAMEKSELFASIAERGVFPRKSFSVGHARDKRYYLECRIVSM